jgi:hypothetical protein
MLGTNHALAVGADGAGGADVFVYKVRSFFMDYDYD